MAMAKREQDLDVPCNDEEMSIIVDINSEDNNQTLLESEDLHKCQFERLEAELQNDLVTSLDFSDCDDSDSSVFEEMNSDYLPEGKPADVTEVNAVTGVTKLSTHSSTGSNGALRSYNEMRKSIPMLGTPTILKNKNNASVLLPTIQNCPIRKLSHRVQEQLLILHKK